MENAVVIGSHGLAQRVEAKRHAHQPPESPRIADRAVRRLEASCRNQHDEYELNHVAGGRPVKSKSDEMTNECPGGKKQILREAGMLSLDPVPKRS